MIEIIGIIEIFGTGPQPVGAVVANGTSCRSVFVPLRRDKNSSGAIEQLGFSWICFDGVWSVFCLIYLSATKRT
jgi:hypothetical protein